MGSERRPLKINARQEPGWIASGHSRCLRAPPTARLARGSVLARGEAEVRGDAVTSGELGIENPFVRILPTRWWERRGQNSYEFCYGVVHAARVSRQGISLGIGT